MGLDGLLSRDEVLEGLPAKRAATLLFLIESRTRHLAALRRRELDRFVSEEAAQERELAYLRAYTEGREGAREVTIQEIERFAPVWADLVPVNPRIRAALAFALGEKYVLPVAMVPGIRQAVGFDDPDVRAAFERSHKKPMDSVYREATDLTNRFRWGLARAGVRLETLPPFWTVFALTVTETVGTGMLALPIAFAGVGALPGLILLIVFSLVNIVTVASLAETITRTGSVRYRNAYFGRVVAEYLGRAGSIMLSVAIASICVVALMGYYFGLSSILEDALNVPAPVWMTALFLVSGFFVTRDSLSSTVASALAVGAINLTMVVVLIGLAFLRFDLDNASHVEVPGLRGVPWDASLLGLVFGVVLLSYFGHLSVGYCGKMVLRRDPSGRSLLWGTVVAQVAALAIYCLWVVAVNGAVPNAGLRGQEGTVLEPLADHAGSIVLLFGSVFAVLGMGMGSIHMSLGLFNIVRDWLPRRTHPIVVLARRGGRLVLRPKHATPEDPSIVITFAGSVHDVAALRLLARGRDGLIRQDIELSDSWDGAELAKALADLGRHGYGLRLERVEATAQWVKLKVESPWSVAIEGRLEDAGFDPADLIEMPGEEASVVRYLTRHAAATAAEIVAATGFEEDAVATVLRRQMETGSVTATVEDGATRYRLKTARRRGRALPDHVWSAMDEKGNRKERRASGDRDLLSRVRGFLASERARLAIAYVPGAIVFALAVGMRLTGRDSYTAVLNFGGVIAVPIFAGVFSSLLLAASRSRGDLVPGLVVKVLGHPLMLIGVYGLFVAGIFLHGLVIWTNPLMRSGALVIGLATLATTVAIMKQGAFLPRVVVTIRQWGEKSDEAEYAVVAAGRPLATPVRFTYPDHEDERTAASGTIASLAKLRAATFRIEPGHGRDLRVLTPRLNGAGEAGSLPVVADLSEGSTNVEADLRHGDGQALLPLDGKGSTLEIRLVDANAT